ncbi:sodium/proton antiporter (CPA1 family) [Homoserinimonas aerilata]|uniref:Sodium/proton antiporter (CPA1 family) n=1 Tax=Homoserinimonas aerilata TaxID=1162970 RepID=A0A542YA60_9MICO|nr:sodium:proton antiporter [Homoserinimonas aerilata]TQL44988.1 sodium/proton antiporter (CPA1 family) [Homoserinimonas aerilata]
MELPLVIVIAVSLIVAFSLVAKRLGIAAPIVLLVVGVGISYLPGVPEIEVPHDVILMAVLPPILYAAALQVPVMDFRRSIQTITSLSVLLVVVSAFSVGFLLYLLLPNLNLAAAIALGAVISPPDAVSAISIGKKLGLPPRLLTVLEGEGLVNDATALVLLRSAIAISAGGVGTIWEGIGDFGYAVVIAIIVGLLIGVITVWVRARLADPLVDTSIALLVPFLAFIPAEELHASGVLAVVVAGLYVGHNAPKFVDVQGRIAERVTWRSVQFILEHGVFLLMGVEIRALLGDIDANELPAMNAVLIGLVATAALIIIRFAWVNPMVFLLQRKAERDEFRALRLKLGLEHLKAKGASGDPRMERRRERVEQAYARMRADLDHTRADGLDWRGGLVLSWSGMRGVVTLAAAQSLPEETPYRAQLILIAFTVAVVTLVLQGSTLPWLIKLIGIEGINVQADRQKVAELLEEISHEGLTVLDDPGAVLGPDTPIAPGVVDRVRSDTVLRIDAAWERANTATPEVGTPHLQYRKLRNAVVQREYDALLRARSTGRYPSRVVREAQAMLEVEETRLQKPGATP